MKFLFINVLVICAYAGLVENQSLNRTLIQRREALLSRTNFVISLVSGQIKLQTVVNRQLFAELLEEELSALTVVMLELRRTDRINPIDAEIVVLENRLEAIEERISSQFRAIGHQFVSKREIQQLLDRTRRLIVLVSETVERLRYANKSMSALTLRKEHDRLKQLEIQLKSTQNPKDIRILEELLLKAESRVKEIVNKVEALGVLRIKSEHKSDLLSRAQQLLKLTNQAVRQLQRQRNQTNAVKRIKRKVAEILLIISDINDATNESDITRIEHRLIALQFALTDDLRSVGKSENSKILRRLLNIIAKTVLKREELEIELSKLRTHTSQTQTQTLEHSVVQMTTKLFDELHRNTSTYRKVLLKITDQLSLKAKIMEKDNRTVEAEIIREEENRMILFKVKLLDEVMTKRKVIVNEEILRTIDKRVYDEFMRLRLTSARNDALIRITELINITNTEMIELKRQNRTAAVSLIQSDYWMFNSSYDQLNNDNVLNATNFGKFMDRLIVNELELSDELRRLGRPLDLNEWRDLLMVRTETLQQWIVVHIDSITNCSDKLENLKQLQKALVSVVVLLRNAGLRSELEVLESKLNTIEENLYKELKANGAMLASRDQIVALERRTEELFIKLLMKLRYLFATIIRRAEALQALETNFIDIYIEVRVAITPQRIDRLETRMSEAERKISL